MLRRSYLPLGTVSGIDSLDSKINCYYLEFKDLIFPVQVCQIKNTSDIKMKKIETLIWMEDTKQ